MNVIKDSDASIILKENLEKEKFKIMNMNFTRKDKNKKENENKINTFLEQRIG